MEDKLRCQELAAFLRDRRERIAPAEAGLPGGGRRRTPGLRREEVAELAGVGVAWYTWLEQGRDIRVSATALEGIVRALRLTADERTHLFLLARLEVPLTETEAEEDVSAATQHILDSLRSPAYITNRLRDVLAWNEAACAVFGDYGGLPAKDRNILRRMFLHGEQRSFHVHWEEDAKDMLARFRADAGIHLGDPRFRGLVRELEAGSPEFRAWWPQRDIARKPRGRKELLHPRAGRIALEYTALQIMDRPSLGLIVFTPLPDEDTIMKMADLLASPSV